MKLTFRQAKIDDIDKAVPLIYSSGPASWEYVFGSNRKGSAINFLKFAFRKGYSQFGANNHIVGTIDGQVVACATYFSKNVQIKYLIQNLICILQYFPISEIFSVMIRGLKIEHVIKPPKKNSHCIAHVGVDPRYRGKGLGQQLMEHFIQLGINLQRNQAELDVAVNNRNAYRLYKRLGFEDQFVSQAELENQFGKVDDHIKMVKRL